MSLVWTATPPTRVKVLDKLLDYACFGPPPGTAPTLVLLHEGLGSIGLWRDFPQALVAATGCGVLAYSRAGYGRSEPVPLPRPFDYHDHEAERVLPAMLDKLGADTVILVGHSDGATIAALHAGRVADPRVAGIVLMAPHFFVEDVALAGLRLAKTAYEEGPLRASLAKYHDHPDIAFHGWNDTWLNPDFKSWRIDDVLDQITVPILALQGREDQYATLEQIDIVARHQPDRTTHVIVENCQHAPHLERPEDTIDAIAHFLGRLRLKSDMTAIA